MLGAHTVAQVRLAEDRLHAVLPPGGLMQRAVAGLTVVLAHRLGRVYGARVTLLVGGGDNGADALWAGALLAGRGAKVTAVLVADPVADALAGFLRAGGRVGPLGRADLVVDGMVGIGGRGPLRSRSAEQARLLEGYDVVAVDVPSGVDATTGEVAGEAVRAALTVTAGTYKPGLLVGAGREHAGEVVLLPLGLDLPEPVVQVLEAADVDALLPGGQAGSDKYTRGVVGIAAGSPVYTGAAVLAVGSALRAGVGMVRFVGARHAAEQVRSRWAEAVVSELDGADVLQAGRVQAWVVGPGLGTDERAAETVEAVLAQEVPVLVDADALTLCAQHPHWLTGRTAPTLLTPHDREYARFGDEVGADRIGAARRLAARLGVTVLLKGDATVVAEPGRTAVRVNATGSPALATAGTGDVLAGACGALLARGLGPLDAGSVGAHLHGRAGALAADGATTTAQDVLATWPDAVREAARLHS